MKSRRRADLGKIITNITLSEAEGILKKHYKHRPGKNLEGTGIEKTNGGGRRISCICGAFFSITLNLRLIT